MRVLIIDDNNDKLNKLISCVVSTGLITREEIDVSYTAIDGRGLMALTQYDLLVLDVVIPLRAGDRPSVETSAGVITELCERTTLRRPRHIIGLTAFDHGMEALEGTFRRQAWAIIKYESDSGAWAEQIKNSVCYIQRASQEKDCAVFSTDVCIIAALETPEYDALRRNGWTWEAPAPLDDTTFIQRSSIQTSDRAFSVVGAYCQKMGMVSAALLASKLIEALRPRLLAMPGICAGVKGKANYGDVVIADPCWDWQTGKHMVKQGKQEFAIAPEQHGIPASIRAPWDQLRADKAFWSQVKEKWPGPPETELKLRFGPAVSGSAVLSDGDIVERIKLQHRGLLALDMEAYGIFAAAQMASGPRPVAFTCKAVCDFADDRKDDQWQTYAAYTSVAALTAFLERNVASLAR